MAQKFEDVLYWPNDAGETPCTTEYRLACEKATDLRNRHDEDPSVYNEWQQAEYDRDVLHATGKHLGTPIRY